jgi:hypothetical protein
MVNSIPDVVHGAGSLRNGRVDPSGGGRSAGQRGPRQQGRGRRGRFRQDGHLIARADRGFALSRPTVQSLGEFTAAMMGPGYDHGNWFTPSRAPLNQMCQAAGFSRTTTVVGPPPVPPPPTIDRAEESWYEPFARNCERAPRWTPGIHRLQVTTELSYSPTRETVGACCVRVERSERKPGRLATT